MKSLAILLVPLITLYSCASQRGNNIAEATPETAKKTMIVSAEKIKDLSDKSHTMIVVTFENTSENWTRYKASTFSCGQTCDAKTNIIVGQDLNTWMKSQYHRRTISQHNNALLYGGAMILGVAVAIAGGASGSEGLAVAGLATYTVGAGGAINESYKASGLNTKTGYIDPQADHLYNPFAVPASGFAKRWILIHTPKNQDISSINLNIENEGGEIETYNVSL